MPFSQDKIRNIAIIAHVDHGKTTLVDGLLKQAHVFASYQSEMQQTTILDSNDLERERGVTILAKNTAVTWGEYKINILDTPGHADFSGEVERVLNMADGCVLLVDASEGVLSQTRYVLHLALKQGLVPIVLINKVDRKDQRVDEVLEEINDLFLDLAENDAQLDFPVIYAIGRDGIAGKQLEPNPDNSLRIVDGENLTPLFDAIISVIPAPEGTLEGGFQMQVTSLDADDYKGKYVIGRIKRGQVKKGEVLSIVRADEGKIGQSKAEYVFTYQGLGRVEAEVAQAGDIIAITGFSKAHIGDTLTTLGKEEAFPALSIAEPTVQMQFAVSTSPFVGKDGKFTTSRQVMERLTKELETNVGLRLNPGGSAESFIVSGRGELHLAVLIETMRREGYEFSVGRPEVIFKEIDGVTSEPWEEVIIEVPEQYVGVTTTEMGQRKAIFKQMKPQKTGMRFEFELPTRMLIGFRSLFQTLTSGTGVVNSLFLGYRPKGEDMEWQRNGVLIASETGQATEYSLEKLQERGITFVDAGTQVYAGMIVGQNNKREDIVMNAVRGKKLTNMRASSSDATVRMAPAVKMSLEQMLTFLGPDELLEVTPLNLRLRKKDLTVANH
jgi:GTP-binding protein